MGKVMAHFRVHYTRTNDGVKATVDVEADNPYSARHSVARMLEGIRITKVKTCNTPK